MSKKIIGIFVGSLREGSFSKKVAIYMASLLEEEYEVRFPDISSLALYNEDLDNEELAPREWLRFRDEVRALDAFLFVTPEYNRSLPAALKNALDIASRPRTDNAWGGKPGGVISVSPGSIGGFGANHHLRQIATCLNILMMQQPEAYIGGISGAVDTDGVSDKGVQDLLRKIAEAYSSWVKKLA